MNKRIFVLRNNTVRQRAIDEIWGAPDNYVVTVQEETRNLEQNAASWPILQAFSEQLFWPVDGQWIKMSPDDWKDVLSAAFNNETIRMAEGLEGGKIMLGMRTSSFSKHQFSEWLEFLHCVAADRGVKL